eukprot:750705-Hanusia_phi.AAC.1
MPLMRMLTRLHGGLEVDDEDMQDCTAAAKRQEGSLQPPCKSSISKVWLTLRQRFEHRPLSFPGISCFEELDFMTFSRYHALSSEVAWQCGREVLRIHSKDLGVRKEAKLKGTKLSNFISPHELTRGGHDIGFIAPSLLSQSARKSTRFELTRSSLGVEEGILALVLGLSLVKIAGLNRSTDTLNVKELLFTGISERRQE